MADDNDNGNNWEQHRKFVVNTLERHEQRLNEIHDLQRETLVAIATLKVKSGVWGAIAGAVPVAILIAIYLCTR